MRRARTERLQLIAPDGAIVVLATAARVVGTVDSQDELAVSPDAKYLAWTTPDDERLHLRDSEGHERLLARYGRRMRFSPDGKWLAATTLVGRGDWQKLVVWELETGRVQSLLVADGLGRFEWAAGGIVIAQGDELVYAPIVGDHRSVFKPAAREHLHRFTAAPAGGRVAVFVATERGLKLRSIDLDHPGKTRELGTVPGDRVENAEQAPDGSRVVFSTPTGLYVVDGNSAPRELSGRRDLHSLWFAADGRLAYASPGGTTVLDGKRARRLEPRDPIHMMRFDRGSSRVLLAAGRDARAWDPATDQQTVLASAPPGEELLGAERYQGGVVLWTGRNGASPPPHPLVRILRASKDGTTSELESERDRTPQIEPTTDGRTVAYRALSDGWKGDGHLRVHTAGGLDRVVAGTRTVLSPTGGHVAVGRFGVPRTGVAWSLVDVATGAERDLVGTQPADATANIAFSPDGKTLATSWTDHDHGVLVLFDVATGQQRAMLPAESIAWTPRGLLVRQPQGLALVSPAGQVRSVLDEPVEAGLARIEANAQSHRVVVCFRGGSTGEKAHPGVVSIDLDASARPVELDIDNCWNRSLWLSPDGEQVVFSTYGVFAKATEQLAVLGTKGGGVPRELGEGYSAVAFDGHGRLAFVSHRGVRVVDANHDELFETDGPVEALQFAKDSALTFAVGRELVAWDVAKGTQTVLVRVPEGQRIVAAAPASDGFLLATVE